MILMRLVESIADFGASGLLAKGADAFPLQKTPIHWLTKSLQDKSGA